MPSSTSRCRFQAKTPAVALSEGRDAALAARRKILFDGLLRTEQVSLQIGLQKWPQDRLRPGAEKDGASTPMVLRLMALRHELPYAAIRAQITGAHAKDLARAHASYQLQLDHGPDWARHKGPDGINCILAHRSHRWSIHSPAAAGLQTRDSLKRGEHIGWNKLLCHGPFENSADTTYLFVDCASAHTGRFHPLPHYFKELRAKTRRSGRTSNFNQNPQG
jgi:hypothetical protein